MHTFVNISAILAILGFVAVQRNKSVDLGVIFVSEPHLREAFDIVCHQCLLLVMYSASVILCLW